MTRAALRRWGWAGCMLLAWALAGCVRVVAPGGAPASTVPILGDPTPTDGATIKTPLATLAASGGGVMVESASVPAPTDLAAPTATMVPTSTTVPSRTPAPTNTSHPTSAAKLTARLEGEPAYDAGAGTWRLRFVWSGAERVRVELYRPGETAPVHQKELSGSPGETTWNQPGTYTWRAVGRRQEGGVWRDTGQVAEGEVGLALPTATPTPEPGGGHQPAPRTNTPKPAPTGAPPTSAPPTVPPPPTDVPRPTAPQPPPTVPPPATAPARTPVPSP